MTTFNRTTDTNWHDLTGRTGADVYNLTNCKLTIDGDTRYGPNTTPTTGPMGNITFNGVSATLSIDGRGVRLIPYTGGSGTVPAADTAIEQGGVSAKLLGVWSAINTTPAAAGAAMPAAGYIKVRQKTGGDYAAGALTGISATASGADIVGWIEVVGVDTSAGVQNSALSIGMRAEYLGEWFELGVTSGVRNQVLQGPASLPETRYPGVFIETAVGSDDFRFWPSAATVTAVAQDERGKFVWCGTQGQVRIGNHGAGDAGLPPAAGLRVVIGNVLLLNTNATAGLGNNVTHTTSANTRYGYTHTLLKTYMSKVMCGWKSIGAGYLMEFYDVCWQDEVSLAGSEAVTYRRIGCGPTGARASVAQAASYTSNLSADSLIEDYNFACITLAGAANRVLNLLSSYGGTFRRGRVTCLTRTFAIPGIAASSSFETVFDDLELVGCNITVPEQGFASNVKYADKVFGTQDGLIPQQAIGLSPNATIDGVTWLIPDANTCHPRTRFIGVSDGGTVRNVGSLADPLPMGTVNPCLTGIDPTGGNAGLRSDFRRIYTTAINGGAATNPITIGPSSTMYDVSMATPTCNRPNLNSVISGYQTAGLQNPSITANFGAHFVDGFYSDTQGFIDFWATAPVAGDSASQFSYSGAKLAGTSWANLPNVGDWLEWTTPWLYGHSGFQNVTQFIKSSSVVSSTVVSTIATIEYDLDKGSGFSGTLTPLSGATLSAETGIDPAVGFRMRVRVTCTVASTNIFYSQRIFTTTTATERYRLHNLSDQIVIVDGLATGSRVKITRADNGAVLFSGLESSGTVRAVLGYVGQVRIEARKASSAPYYQPWVSLATLAMKSTTTITAVQLRDDQ